MSTLENYKAERKELEKKAEKLQKEVAAKTFTIEIEDVKMIKTIKALSVIMSGTIAVVAPAAM